MDWRLKCLAFHCFERMPFGTHAYAAMQRHITGSYFTKLTPERLSLYHRHVEEYRRGRQGRALEFGAGGDLLAPLLLSAANAPEILTFDIVPLATHERVNDMIRQLREAVPGDWPTLSSLADLWPAYRIRYMAPADVRATSLPAASIDFMFSTSTFEHIEAENIGKILLELRRIAAPDARLSFVIDYHDHYAEADASISEINFLRFSKQQWKRYNPSWHYQNRLRHSDYRAFFADAGFEIQEDIRLQSDWHHGAARSPTVEVPVHPDFAAYTTEDLSTMRGVFVLRLSGPAAG